LTIICGRRGRADESSTRVPTRNPGHQDGHFVAALDGVPQCPPRLIDGGLSGSGGDLSRVSLSVGDFRHAQIVSRIAVSAKIPSLSHTTS
jgi:hypothetical protein